MTIAHMLLWALAQILVVPAALFLTGRLFEGTEVRHAGTMANLPRPLSHVLDGVLLAQPSISSQLVDNLNAFTHLHALLTDLFLMNDILRSQLTLLQIR